MHNLLNPQCQELLTECTDPPIQNSTNYKVLIVCDFVT